MLDCFGLRRVLCDTIEYQDEHGIQGSDSNIVVDGKFRYMESDFGRMERDIGRNLARFHYSPRTEIYVRKSYNTRGR